MKELKKSEDECDKSRVKEQARKKSELEMRRNVSAHSIERRDEKVQRKKV